MSNEDNELGEDPNLLPANVDGEEGPLNGLCHFHLVSIFFIFISLFLQLHTQSGWYSPSFLIVMKCLCVCSAVVDPQSMNTKLCIVFEG